jgi:hypothetical protein
MMALSRVISALLIAAALGSGAVRVALAGPETTTADDWRVLESQGGARFRPATERHWWPARTGSKIPHGSSIATGSSGFLIVARAGESITVRPNSRVELPGEATAGQVRQAAGDLRYRITRAPDRRFAVETPYLSLLVKGTVFGVVVGDRGAEVQVSEGRVQVDAARGQVVELNPGQSARIAAHGQADLEVRSAPESPFVAAPSPHRSIAATYANDDIGWTTRSLPPVADQGPRRSDRTVSLRAGSSRPASDAAAGRDGGAAGTGGRADGSERAGDHAAAHSVGGASAGAAALAGSDPAEAAISGIEIGVSDGRMWIDAARAQVGEATPDQPAIARNPRADLGSGTASENPFVASLPEPQTTTAAAQSGADDERAVGGRPRETEAMDRAASPSAGGGSRDLVVWAMLVVLAAALWWRLRRSRHAQSFGQGAARRWPWQRSRLTSSGSGAGSPAHRDAA